MDIATLLGFIISLGLIGSALADDFGAFIDIPSVLIVFGGTVGATMINFPMANLTSIGKVFRKAFFGKSPSTEAVIDQFVDLSNRARREGILALESVVKGLDDPYMRKGMQLTVDGLEPEAIQAILEAEISNLEGRHEAGVDLLNALAAFAPALGMIGTVIGLVLMLKNMDDPSTIGPSMAVALITTFYGAFLANIVFIPIAGKLKSRTKEEVHIMEMKMEGILGISRGENPRIILEKLTSFQPPKIRKEIG